MKFSIGKFDTYIFDFDGVIVDSVNIKTEAFAELYRPFGEKVVCSVVAHHISHGGLSRFDKISYYHKNYLNKTISSPELNRLVVKFSGLVFGKVIKAPYVDGALDFLRLLKSKKKKVFLLSATPEKEIKKIAKKRRLYNYFLDIKGSPVAKKDNLRSILQDYKIDVARSVYFGDSNEDLKAALAVGVTFIPINYFDKRKGESNLVKFAKL